jgi:hypothetical protein
MTPRTPILHPDVSKFSKLPNGNDLETGKMPNPDAGGEVMAYEEVWHPLEWSLRLEQISTNWVLESVDGESSSGGRKSFYANIGKFYLAAPATSQDGVVRYAAIRQDLDKESDEWKVVYQIGETGWVEINLRHVNDREWKVDDRTHFGGDHYAVRAVSSV